MRRHKTKKKKKHNKQKKIIKELLIFSNILHWMTTYHSRCPFLEWNFNLLILFTTSNCELRG